MLRKGKVGGTEAVQVQSGSRGSVPGFPVQGTAGAVHVAPRVQMAQLARGRPSPTL